jgi:RNA polymerase sigma-70 factor (ECF subfamily)
MNRGTADDNRAAVERIFRDQYARLVVVLSAQLRDPGAAEECAQEAFLEMIRRWNKLRDYDDPTAWLWLVALRKASRWRKRNSRRVTGAPALPTPPELEVLIDLHDAVRGLPDRQRDVVTLFYFADLAVGAIARELGISEGTVKSQLHDARQALRRTQDERPII